MGMGWGVSGRDWVQRQPGRSDGPASGPASGPSNNQFNDQSNHPWRFSRNSQRVDGAGRVGDAAAWLDECGRHGQQFLLIAVKVEKVLQEQRHLEPRPLSWKRRKSRMSGAEGQGQG